jgi:hypothetical protein
MDTFPGSNLRLVDSYPFSDTSGTGWVVTVFNVGGSAETFHTDVVCMKAA